MIARTRSATTALILCIFLGFAGAHRFYAGRYGTAVLMLLTLGGLGVWVIVDIIALLTGDFRDSEGRVLEFNGPQSNAAEDQFLKFSGAIATTIVIYAGIACLVYLAYAVITGGMQVPIREQLQAIRNGDYAKAYTYTTRQFQKNTPLELFKKNIELIPILKNNRSYSIVSRDRMDGEGYVKVILKSVDGDTVPVKYWLAKEDSGWKIKVMMFDTDNTRKEISTKTAEPPVANVSQRLYKDDRYNFSINYPADWQYQTGKRGMVIFSGQKDSGYVSININVQPLLTRRKGGKYADAQAFINDMHRQIEKLNGSVVDENDIELPQNTAIHGKAITFTYNYQGIAIKQMQFILVPGTRDLMYVWGYTAPASEYEKGLPIGKAMYESFKVW